MKIIKNILAFSVVLIFAVSCNEGIDPITPISPGPDLTAPEVTINSPEDTTTIPFTETQTDITIDFEVTDDIEIKDITLSLDGNQLASYSDFKDYRRALESFIKKSVPIGDHLIQIVATDLSGKTTTQDLAFTVTNVYNAKYNGEIFYMPFEGGIFLDLISKEEATIVGSPGFTEGKVGNAYSGATGSYLTFPAESLQGNQFSAVFWMKINADPDRAGILVMSPEDTENPNYPAIQNNRKSGFRFIRENAEGKQRFKLNTGNGTTDTWFDGGSAADVDPATGNWVHFAFTISGTRGVVYINGEIAAQGTITGIDWTGCNLLSIMSGDPRFNEWDHHSDLSSLDELRLFNKELTQAEIQTIIDNEN